MLGKIKRFWKENMGAILAVAGVAIGFGLAVYLSDLGDQQTEEFPPELVAELDIEVNTNGG